MYYFYKISQKGEEVNEETEIAEPSEETETAEPSEENTAEQTLADFFTYLHNKEYAKAAPLYAWEDAEDPGNVLYSYTVPNDRAKTLENFCKQQPCLKVKVLNTEKLSDTQYKFTVQFLEDDGQIYVYTPCCGANEEEMPSIDEFEYKVKELDGSYKVITPPFWRP